MKYGDVKATLTGRLQVATVPAAQRKITSAFFTMHLGKWLERLASVIQHADSNIGW